MACFHFKAQGDAGLRILKRLNNDDSIAFVVPRPGGGWIATPTVDVLSDGPITLWHLPGPALTIPTLEESDLQIPDPWAGWTELRPGQDPTTPYFGPGHPSIIRLTLRVTYRGGSIAEWIGNYYRCIGRPAAEATSRWWSSFKRFTKGRSL